MFGCAKPLHNRCINVVIRNAGRTAFQDSIVLLSRVEQKTMQGTMVMLCCHVAIRHGWFKGCGNGMPSAGILGCRTAQSLGTRTHGICTPPLRRLLAMRIESRFGFGKRSMRLPHRIWV